MWVTEYIDEIQKKLITDYGFKAGPNGLPANVPDGVYPMKIEGKLDKVRIENGRIYCCNFEEEEADV
jgi:hypothetical protein